MDKKQIVLTEQDLHMLVEDAVRVYLQENDMEEGIIGGLQNVWRGVGNNNYHFGANYKAGNVASNFAKYAQQAQNAINQMRQIAIATNNTQVDTYLGNVSTTLERTVGAFNETAKAIAAGPTDVMSRFALNNKQMKDFGYGRGKKQNVNK